MDGNNWRAAHAHAQIPGQVMGTEPVANGAMEDGDWRGQLHPDYRQRIVNKIMETLKRHLPYSGQEGLQELKKIAVRFEEKIYVAATNQSDYLRKISMKMLTMETKSQNPDSMQPGGGNNSQNPASQGMQPQIQNQVQQLQLPMVSNQSQVRQQILSQNFHNNIAMNGVPNSAGLSSALPAMSGTMPNVPGPNANNIQNMESLPNMASNGIGNSMGQGMSTGTYANPQRQIQNRQQPVTNQELAQQSQGSHQYAYNQQVFMKPKFQQTGIPQQSMMQAQAPQQQQQQQNLMQPNQLQSSQQAVMQPSLRQTSSPSSSSSTLQNPQSSLQHSNQSLLQQPSQPVLRQQQQQQPQAPVMHQQQNSITQHSILSSQQQHHAAQQPNSPNIQPNQLIGQQNLVDTQQQQRMMAQQNSMPNMQQQHTVSKQNNLPSLHQQQSAAQQNNISNVHQQQFGSQNNISGFQQQQVQQMQGSMQNVLPNQPQSQPVQHQLMSQMQSQPGQMQQQLGLQQQANTLSRDMQQRIQTSGPLNQQQPTIDQKQLIQPQRVIGESQINPSSQIGNSSGGDWQEEVYQKIKSMHDMYYPELNDTYQRMVAKLQQHDSIPQLPKSDQLEKVQFFKTMLEQLLMFLRISKNEIQPAHKDKTVQVEKQIINILNSRPRRPVSSLQKGQPGQPHMLAVQQPQQQQPQISQIHTSEGQMNPQMQSPNGQGSVMNSLSNLQHGSMSSVSGVTNSRQSMMDVMQPGSNIDTGQGNALGQMPQVAMNSLQQNSVSGPQQMNITSVTSQAGMATLASAVNPLQGNSNVIQGQQIKQEPQMFPSQQMKQQYQRQQYIQRQQIIQQQQQLQSQQQAVQMPGQQMAHLNQMNDANDVKLRHQMVGKTGILHPHSSSQRPTYHHQSFSMPSQQVLQVPSPQIAHNSSPQMEQQSLLVSHTKVRTPLQSANSPFVVPSPSTSVAPSPMPGDSEKIVSGVTSLANAGNSLNPPTSAAALQNQSLAIGTPGISASPLLAEFTNADGAHGVLSNAVPGSTSAVERPLDRLLKAVKSLSPVALSACINDISSVVSLTDRIAGSAPGNGSRAAMGEDLVAMTKCRLQARNFFSKDEPRGTKRMRRHTSAMTSNVVPCTGNESFRNTGGNESNGQSTELACIKRPKHEANHVLEEELQEINMGLIDTIVHISDDVGPTAVAAAAECAEGTVVKCSFRAVGLGPNLKSQFASAQMSPIQPLRLLIPKDYPSCSPVLLDKFPIEVSKEYEDLYMKAKSRFSISLRTLAQPMSLGDIARTWDRCARDVISEYAQLSGGGTFSSKYGNWEKCLSAA